MEWAELIFDSGLLHAIQVIHPAMRGIVKTFDVK